MSKRIAICSTDSSPSSQIDGRFGRCSCFMLWDPETKQYESLSNSGTEAGHGAGTGAVQTLLQKDVGFVITQRVGPKAFVALEQAGVKMFACAETMTVDEALKRYESGELKEILAPNN